MAAEVNNRTLGDYFTLQRGTTYKSSLLGSPGPVLLGLATIKRNGGFRSDSLKTYGGDSQGKLLVRAGELYLSLKDVTQSADLLGAVARLPPEHAPGRLTQDTVKLAPKSADAPLDYLYWLLRTPHYRAYCRSHATGTTNLGLAREDFLAFPAPAPTAQQHKIVETLNALDDRIELNRRRNQTLEAMVSALFKDWFVDFGPVRAKIEGLESYLPTDLWYLFPDRVDDEGNPEGWRTGTLSDVASHPRRSVQPNKIKADTPYIALEHMPRQCIALSDWGDANDLESNKFEFRKGEVLFGKLRPYFHKVGVAAIDGVCSTDILVIDAKDARWFGFVLGHLSSKKFVEYTNAGSTGTRMPRTSWSEMARYEFALPPAPVAEAFNKIVGPWIEQIIASIHESRTLVQLRDTLLPKLITGELRIADAERFIEERAA
ncbi:restriction endonuclease subunit S [Luteimonas abyssi]|uniref:restriction endonuclease subunit S n=1 Tax=Luteimonas abyssi TaxID=1247514 RepID=UPI0009E78790|nr:restriction endonuclease subunit S [Luteimonas abyssi]